MNTSFNAITAANNVIKAMGAKAKQSETTQQWIEDCLKHIAAHGNTNAFQVMCDRLEGATQFKANGKMHWPALHAENTVYDGKQKMRMAKDWELVKKYIRKVSGLYFEDGKCIMPKSWMDKKPVKYKIEGTWDMKAPKAASAPKVEKTTLQQVQAYVAGLAKKDNIMVACLQEYMATHLEKDMEKMRLAHAKRAEEVKEKEKKAT